MTQKQSSTVTPTALPIVEAKQSSTDITTWKTFTSTDGIYSFKYPAQSLKPFEGVGPDDGIYGTTLYPREGYIGILVYDKQLPCPHGEIQQLQLHGKTIAACHSISDDGSESWEGLVTYPTKTFKVIGSTEPTHMMSGTMTAGEDKKVILQILSTLTFQ